MKVRIGLTHNRALTFPLPIEANYCKVFRGEPFGDVEIMVKTENGKQVVLDLSFEETAHLITGLTKQLAQGVAIAQAQQSS